MKNICFKYQMDELTPEQVEQYEQQVFDEAWDDVLNSEEFIRAVNERIHELIKELIGKENRVLTN
jgi:hypothetical protein